MRNEKGFIVEGVGQLSCRSTSRRWFLTLFQLYAEPVSGLRFVRLSADI